jgi:hypothetical protein
MPARIKVLYITTLNRTGGWLAEAFAADCAAEVVLVETVGVTAGLSHLREEVFDAVLISHEPAALDSLELIEGLRAGGNDETRSLLWTFARAIERCQLVREHRRLVQLEQQRLAHEHHEAERLLAEQRALIAELECIRRADVGSGLAKTPAENCRLRTTLRAVPADCGLADVSSPQSAIRNPQSDLPDRLVTHYREMLRAYVVMGAGNLADEMTTLAGLLADADVSAQRTMQLHVHVLEELIGSLGNRSARHVMTRADLLCWCLK